MELRLNKGVITFPRARPHRSFICGEEGGEGFRSSVRGEEEEESVSLFSHHQKDVSGEEKKQVITKFVCISSVETFV